MVLTLVCQGCTEYVFGYSFPSFLQHWRGIHFMKNILLVGALMELYFIGWSGKISIALLKLLILVSLGVCYFVLSYSILFTLQNRCTTFYIFCGVKIMSQVSTQLDEQAVSFIWQP
jgi:glucan phosphoethanolaminetransferase (alkaline phosphatase superfamily)